LSVTGENSLLERVTAAAEERQLSHNSLIAYRRSQLQITAPRYEDVRAFVHKLLRGGKANAVIATSKECNFLQAYPYIFSLVVISLWKTDLVQ
jgi:hypothetical protein